MLKKRSDEAVFRAEKRLRNVLIDVAVAEYPDDRNGRLAFMVTVATMLASDTAFFAAGRLGKSNTEVARMMVDYLMEDASVEDGEGRTLQ